MLSLDITDDLLKVYLYLKQENILNDDLLVLSDEKEVIEDYISSIEDKLGIAVNIKNDKMLMGKKLDVYSVLETNVLDKVKGIKILSLLYPFHLLKGYPYREAEKFLENNQNTGYGFWYAPFGYINKNLDTKFYTCANMMIIYQNIITLFTNIVLSKGDSYDNIVNKSNRIVESSLKLFDH